MRPTPGSPYPEFHSGPADQTPLFNPSVLRMARFLRRMFFQLPILVGSSRFDAGTDWSALFRPHFPDTPGGPVVRRRGFEPCAERTHGTRSGEEANGTPICRPAPS
jgi:hypothetical protein